MPYGFWGAANEIGLRWPQGWLPNGLLLLYLALLFAGFYRYRTELLDTARGRIGALVSLVVASFFLSQFLPLHVPRQNPVLAAQPTLMAVGLLATAPYILAAATMNPGAAMLVGLAGGFGRSLGQTHLPFDVFHIAFAAWLASLLLQQNYAGRPFTWLREPIVAGPLAQSAISLLNGLATLVVLWPAAGFLDALDMALVVGAAGLPLLLLEGLIGGGIVSILLRLMPQWRPARAAAPSPFKRSLQRYLAASFLWFTLALVMLSAIVVFFLSARSATNSLVRQLADDTDAVAGQIAGLQSELADELTRYGVEEQLAATDPRTKDQALARIIDAAPAFAQVLLIEADGSIRAVRPDGSDAVSDDLVALTPAEEQAVADAVFYGKTRLAEGQPDSDIAFSLVAPASVSGREQKGALLGRVAGAAISSLLAQVFPTDQRGTVFVVGRTGQVIAGAGDDAPAVWEAPSSRSSLPALPDAGDGVVYEALHPQTGARQIVYFTRIPDAESEAFVVSAVSRGSVLRQALGVLWPLALLLLAACLLFYVNMSTLGRSVAGPIGELVQATKAIAGGGGLDKPVRTTREDEVGQLAQAFALMQRSLKQRLEELSLLLSVSNELAATVNLDHGMPVILQGVLRGTGAAGARAIVRNPLAPEPLVFAEGPAAESMAPLDRAVIRLVRQSASLALTSPQAVQEDLGLETSPLGAVYAMPLTFNDEFQGALYVGYRQAHYFDDAERDFLRTLSGQATVLVHNAHLFAAAEGGRRRLRAILASTIDAVIVTDQTDRVLLINPAMERAFKLNAEEAIGRPVRDAIESTALAERLSLKSETAAQPESENASAVELEVGGRTYVASVATVNSSLDQPIGRVAVLHDVTEYKELDRMKSGFLADISHDLLSPLTYIYNYAAMIPLVDDQALQLEYAEKIQGGVKRMSTLVRDLLDLGEIEAGVNMARDRIQVDRLLEEVATEYRLEARLAGIDLETHASSELPTIEGDPTLIRRAVTNLVANGIKHAPNSGSLRLGAEQLNGEVIISVQDHGPGIPEEEQLRLFEKFYRGKQSVADKKVGSGLGLAIVRSIAEQHGGRVWCSSRPGQGSTFYVALPPEGAPNGVAVETSGA